MNEKDKIIKLMNELGLNSKQFASEVGMTSSALSHILNDRNKVSLDILKKILARFNQISSDWLILGEGPMYRQKTPPQQATLFAIDEEDPYKTEDYPSSMDNTVDPKTAPDIDSKLQQLIVSTATAKAPPRRIKKIIVYFDDKSFQEFGED